MPEQLDIDDVDVESLILARNDVHPDGDWWFDPRSGTSLYYSIDDGTDLPALVEGVHVLIPCDPQPKSDVDEFFAQADQLGLDDDTVAELYTAYRGKGGLRRFRDRVATSAAADAWRQFTIDRESRRAIEWLRSRGIVDSAAEREHA